jgi:tRNA (Thr-GGU) A37 N-methylase
MDEIKYKPIGVVHSPFKKPKGTPIQPSGAKNIEGTVELFPEYTDGLKDLEDFSHHFGISFPFIQKGFLKGEAIYGWRSAWVFAIRGPSRPNPIGISVVRLVKIEENILLFKI